MSRSVRITAISDLHGEQPELDGGDLLLIAGDVLAWGTNNDHDQFCEWAQKQPYEKVIYIGGNHDNCLEGMSPYKEGKLEYLFDSGTEWEGIKIWGSPWSVYFWGVNAHCRAFMVAEDALKFIYKKIPEDIDILMTHTPPYKILDETRYSNVGSWTLMEAILKTRPKLCVFGHIHEQGGQIFPQTFDYPPTTITFVNAALLDRDYIANNPIVKLSWPLNYE